MVEKFNIDMHVGTSPQPPFYLIVFKKQMTKSSNKFFVVIKKTDIVKDSINGLISVIGFWTDNMSSWDDDLTKEDLSKFEICSLIIPTGNIEYIKSLIYKPR